MRRREKGAEERERKKGGRERREEEIVRVRGDVGAGHLR
jgi:hypothetical protein